MTNVFNIELPDGRVVGIQANSPEEAARGAKNVMMREASTKRGREGGVGNFFNSAVNTLTMGFGDELGAAADATLPTQFLYPTSEAPTWKQRYDENLGNERAQAAGYAEENPVWDAAGKVTGGVMGLAGLPAGAAKNVLLGTSPGLLKGTARSAATGGGLSVPYGFGEGEGGVENRVDSAGKHGAMGLLGGALLHPVGMGLRAGVNAALESGPGRYVADKVVKPGFNMMADAFDSVAPKVKPQNLSAAAPDGGAGIPTDSVLGRVAEGLRMTAPSGENILDNAAARRIADALQRGGDDVPGMRVRMGELGEGSMPLDVNPMTQRLASTMFISPGSAPKTVNAAMKSRNDGTPERVVGSVRQAMGDSDPAVIEAARLKGLRSGEGRVNYEDAVGADASYVISPEMRDLMQRTPAIREAMDRIEKEAAKHGKALTPAQIAHRVKQQITGDADAAFMSGRAVNKGDVGDTAGSWRAALHKANPAIKAADEAWEAGTKRMDALDLGRQFMRQGMGEIDDSVSPTVLAKRIPEMSAEEAQAFISGASDTLITRANSGPNEARAVIGKVETNRNLRAKLTAMIGEDNTKILYNRAMSEKAFAESDRVVRGGSDTARKVLSTLDEAASGELPLTPNSMLNRIASSVAGAYNKSRAGNEAVRERIAKMLTETDVVANDELITRIANQLSMAKRPRGIQRGAVTGASGQE